MVEMNVPHIASSEDTEATTLVPTHDVATSGMINANDQVRPGHRCT